MTKAFGMTGGHRSVGQRRSIADSSPGVYISLQLSAASEFEPVKCEG